MKSARHAHHLAKTIAAAAILLALSNRAPAQGSGGGATPLTIVVDNEHRNQDASHPIYPADDSSLLLKNGNFSEPQIPIQNDSNGNPVNFQWKTFDGILGWSAILGKKVELQRFNNYPGGHQYCELDSHWKTGNHKDGSDHGIEQPVSLAQGRYVLIFDYHARRKGLDYVRKFTVAAEADGKKFPLATIEGHEDNEWHRASMSLEVSGGNPDPNTGKIPMKLKFDIPFGENADSYGAFLDNVMLFPADIKEVISDQIAGNEANKLPTRYYRHEANNPMLMATRTKQDARLAIKMDVPANLAPRFYVGVRQQGKRAIISSAPSVPAPGKTLLGFTALNGSKTYEIVAGYDMNANGKLDPADVSIIFQKTPRTNEDGTPYSVAKGEKGDPDFVSIDRVIVVSEDDFIEARTSTFGYGILLTDTANRLLLSFAGGYRMTKVLKSGGSGAEVACVTEPDILIKSNEKGLSHPLGERWKPTNEHTTYRTIITSDALLASTARKTNALNTLYKNTIAKKENQDHLWTTATSNLLTAALPIPLNDEISFQNTDRYSDAHLSLGKCSFSGKLEVRYRVVTGVLEIEKIKVTGQIDDIYDFGWGSKVPGFLGNVFNLRNPTRVQAGHASLAKVPFGNSGKVFFTRVMIDSGWFNWNRNYEKANP